MILWHNHSHLHQSHYQTHQQPQAPLHNYHRSLPEKTYEIKIHAVSHFKGYLSDRSITIIRRNAKKAEIQSDNL